MSRAAPGSRGVAPSAGRGPRRTLACLLLVAVVGGCRREPAAPPLPPPEPEQPRATAPEPRPEQAAAAIPPTLAELEGQVTWVDRRVGDAVALAREQDSREPPATSVAEALATPNDSPEANARILAALTRPPAAGGRGALDRVTRHLTTDPGSLNPALAETAAEFAVAEFTGVDLIGFDRGLEPFANADTVATWRSSTDGLVDMLVLRGDLTWSDGRPVTAGDVAFTWRLLADPRVPARAFRDQARRLRAVQAYDDRTVVFFHEQSCATAAWDIDLPVLPRHAYEATWNDDPTLVHAPPHAALEARPVTGGPYEVVARTPGRELVLGRRAGWSSVGGRKVREPPPVGEIRFRVVDDPATALEALEAGGLDEAALAPGEWASATTSEAFTAAAARVTAPAWHGCQFAWNNASAVFGDRRVRRAMGYAFDHDRLLDTLCQGVAVPSTGIFPPGSWPAARRRLEPYRLDLDKAEALLDEAGWIDHDGDGIRDREVDGRVVPLEFTVLCDRRPFRVATCTLLRDCLARVGVTCIVHAVEPAELRDLVRSGRFEAALVAWGTGVDPDTTAAFWTTDGPRNACGYSNPEVDRLFAEGRGERDRERRAEQYGRIEEILAEDQPCMWLVWIPELRGLSRRLEGGLFGLRMPTHYAPGLSSIWLPALE